MRFEVVKLIGTCGDHRATLPLIELIPKEEKVRTRRILLFAIIVFGFSAHLLILIPLIALCFPRVRASLSVKGIRSEIVNSLALIRDRRALAILIANLNRHKSIGDNWTVRITIIHLLSSISKAPEAVHLSEAEYKSILSLLNQDDQLCWSAMEALKVAGKRDAIIPLNRVKKHATSPHFATFADETIGEILFRESQLQDKSTLLRASSPSNTSPDELLRPLPTYQPESEETASLLRPSDQI